MDPHSRAAKKKTGHGNEVLAQDTVHLLQRPCYQRGCLCQDPAGSWTIRRPPDHCKEMQIEVVLTCLLFIRSGQNYLGRGRRQYRQKKRWEDNIREWTGLEFAMGPEGSGEERKMEESGCEAICGGPTTPEVKRKVNVCAWMGGGGEPASERLYLWVLCFYGWYFCENSGERKCERTQYTPLKSLNHSQTCSCIETWHVKMLWTVDDFLCYLWNVSYQVGEEKLMGAVCCAIVRWFYVTGITYSFYIQFSRLALNSVLHVPVVKPAENTMNSEGDVFALLKHWTELDFM